MKKSLLFFSFLFFTVYAQAQIVNIPDAIFKNKLLNYTPSIDTNSDGEIQVSEALVVTALDVSNFFPSDLTGIIDLTGINSFTNLITLDCSSNYLTALDVTGLINLQSLVCSGLAGISDLRIATLNVSGLTNLITLDCSSNDLISLDVSGLTNLETLNCKSNLLSSINTTGAINIIDLDLGFCGFSSLDLTNLTNLKKLDCRYQFLFTTQGLLTLNISGLNSLTSLNCSSNSLTVLDVSTLTSLIELNCNSNQFTTLDLAPLTNLTQLGCGGNQLTTLDVAPLTNLTVLGCNFNFLTALDVTNLTNLINFGCGGNQLTTLDLTSQTLLVALYCDKNQLTTLDLTSQTLLNTLTCGENQLTSLNLEQLDHLTTLNCSNNLLTTLDISNSGTSAISGFQNITFANNPNLINVNLKNQNTQPTFTFDPKNCPALRYICANENIISSINTKLIQQNSPTNTTLSSNVQVNSYCSFEPAGNYNTITGNIKLDFNNNGCDPSDILLNEIKVFINDGTNIGAAFTNPLGNYTFYTQTGSFVVTPNFENPFFTVSPTNATIDFANSNNNTQTQNFCITALGIHHDLEIVLIPITPARPGFNATYQLVYKNKGNQVQSGNINLNFNDAILDFVSANPTTTSQSLNNLNWDFTNLNPFESRTIDFTLNVNSPMETPAVNIGDILGFTTTASPTEGDETPQDNVFNFNQVVIGSFDPNDKTCLEGNNITPEMVGNYLHYVIRFQNSGTAAAENVVVKDVIDTTKFEMNSLQLTSSSHPYEARISGNKIEFIFENINLPAEIDDEPGSHGFVAFKIKTKSNLVLGNEIKNTADIFFDFNFPIVTNTTSTIVAVLNVNDFDKNTVAVSPIPVVDMLQIKALETITRVQLFDIQGRLLQSKVVDSSESELDFSGKAKGVYLVKIQTAKGLKVQKVIKE